MNHHSINYVFIFFLVSFLASCEKDPVIPNEEELITTLIYTLTPVGGGDAVVFSFRDLDGDGGQTPVVTLGELQPHSQYNGQIELLNEAESPVTDITEEVSEEAEEHQFFYEFTDVMAAIDYADQDANVNPIGITTVLSTGDTGEGLMTITLRHLPDKFATGVSDGWIINAGGETDIEVSFLLRIQ